MQPEQEIRHSLFQRIVSFIVLTTFSCTALFIPTAQAGTSIWVAPTSGVGSAWSGFAAVASNWIHATNSAGYGQGISLPRDDWTQIGSMTWSRRADQQGFNWQMIRGDRWITYNRETAARAGLTSAQINNTYTALPKNASYVFAQYVPESATLIIEMQKVERLPNGTVGAYRADFTPWHGEWNKWRREYLSTAEFKTPAINQIGYNPFEKFKGASVTDNVFHNISWEAASVAIGLAMIHCDAHFAFVSAETNRFTQHTKKSGGLFTKTITTYIDGYATPQWFVGSFVEAQPDGGIASICVKSVGAASANGNTASCDDPGHLASSMISMKLWNGGNMPSNEDHMYSYVNKKTSFTMMAFTILTFIVSYGMLSALTATIGLADVGISAAGGAAIGAGVYAGVGMLSGASLTDAQAGWAGNTGDGVLTPNTGAWSSHESYLVQGIKNKMINSRVGTGMTGDAALYHGNCTNEAMTKTQCIAAGLDPGQMHRADSFHDVNSVVHMRTMQAQCLQENPALTGVALEQCAVGITDSTGTTSAWTVTTGQ